MTEEWKPIEGHEGLYEVSSMGNVRSVDRIVLTKNGERRYVGKIRKQSVATHGYLVVSLSKVGAITTATVHTLVARAFLDHPGGDVEVCHDDGDKMNNKHTNLRWDTRLENIHDQTRHGTMRVGSDVMQSRLTEPQVMEIKRLLASGHGQTALGRQFGVAPETIHSIKAGKSWKHVAS